jgi:LuxR family transcriptional regulator
LGWFWDAAQGAWLTQDERAFLHQTGGTGQPAGYLLSFPSDTTRLKGGLGMMAPRGWSQAQMDALWSGHGKGIEAMCIADGKSLVDVCVLTDLLVAPIEKHLRGARDAQDVETTAQAVARDASGPAFRGR